MSPLVVLMVAMGATVEVFILSRIEEFPRCAGLDKGDNSRQKEAEMVLARSSMAEMARTCGSGFPLARWFSRKAMEKGC